MCVFVYNHDYYYTRRTYVKRMYFRSFFIINYDRPSSHHASNDYSTPHGTVHYVSMRVCVCYSIQVNHVRSIIEEIKSKRISTRYRVVCCRHEYFRPFLIPIKFFIRFRTVRSENFDKRFISLVKIKRIRLRTFGFFHTFFGYDLKYLKANSYFPNPPKNLVRFSNT